MRAPRLRASMPTAPVPAYASIHTESASGGEPVASTLKSVSRRRSEVGRTFASGGDFSRRLRNFPAMTRTVFFLLTSTAPAHPSVYTIHAEEIFCGHGLFRRADSLVL